MLVVVLALTVGATKYAATPKEYRATALIQIERGAPVALRGLEQMWLEAWWNTEYYPTQYRLLRSRGLAERVVLNLRLDEDPTFQPGGSPLRRSEGTITPDDDNAALAGMAGRVLGGLEVNPLASTQLVEISYRSGSPELAAKIANGVVDAYIDWGIETRTTVAGKAATFYGQQIEALKSDLSAKEEQLQAYGQRTDIVSLDPGTNVTLQRLEALNREYIGASSARISAEAKLRELEAMTGAPSVASLDDPLLTEQKEELVKLEREYAAKLSLYKPEWPAMVDLKRRIDEARRALDAVARRALVDARERARAAFQTAQRQERALVAELERAKGENRQLSSAAVEYTNLQIEISTKRQLLNELLRNQSETDVSSRLQATRESNVRIVDRALVPGGPFRPSLRRNLTLGLGAGLAIGLGLTLLLHYMDRTLKTTDEVERLLQLPLLATIPDVSTGGKGLLRRYGYGYGYGAYGYGRRRREASKPPAVANDAEGTTGGTEVQIELLPHTRPRLAVSEAYRTLRTALLLSTADELKVVAVTSAVPGEGKTSTAANLAVVLAQLGKRVLLVDADLRKPRVHEIFGGGNRVGLVSFLTLGAEVESVVFQSRVPNLFVVPSGPVPPNPSELLSAARMREFLAWARRQFDYVIVDSAPTLAVTDAILTGALTDGVVLCLRAGYVQRRDAKACRERLLQSEIKLLGAVLNCHSPHHGSYRGGYPGSYTYEAYGSQADSPAGKVAAL